MRVAFTKTGSRCYGVRIEREHAPALAMASAPGFDVHLPHDLLHFVAEAEWGLDGGVFGDLAAGGNARTFVPVDPALVAKLWRRQRRRRTRLPDGRRSERIASVLEHAWGRRRHGTPAPPEWRERLAEAGVTEAEVATVLPRLDELAAAWRALPVGESLTLEWPRPERRAGRRRG